MSSSSTITVNNNHSHTYTYTYTQQKWPASRNNIVDAGYFANHRHFVHGLIQVDVTDVRSYIRQQKQQVSNSSNNNNRNDSLLLSSPSSSSLSFTGYIVKCLADTIAQHHPMAHAYRNFWGTRLVIPTSVDVVCLIEHEKDGVALPHIIRRANEKSWHEISQEIRRVQQQQPTVSKQNNGCLVKLGGYMPACFRRMFLCLLLCRPVWIIQMMGTTVVSSIGMFGSGSFWGIGFVPFHTMGVFVGGIERKPVFTNNENHEIVVAREYLSLTLSFDHDIVDGAPAARFAQTFKEIMESRAYFNADDLV